MTKLLEKAFEQAKGASPDQQDNIAQMVLDMVAGDKVWDVLLASDASQNWLEAQARMVESQIANGESFDFDPSDRPL